MITREDRQNNIIFFGVVGVVIALLFIWLGIKGVIENATENTPTEELDTIDTNSQQEFIEIQIDTLDLNKENLDLVLQYYGIEHPEIVLAQAILETGHFKSDICLLYNNLFGLYNSKVKDYYVFNHWTDSVEGYYNLVQKKYINNKYDYDHYLDFLAKLPYATDPEYISKIKRIAGV